MSFVFRAVDEVGATLNTALVVMGDKLGLYTALSPGRASHPVRAGGQDRHLGALHPGMAERPGGRRIRRVPARRRPLHASAGAGRRLDGSSRALHIFPGSSRSLSDRSWTRHESPKQRGPAPASAGTTTCTTCTKVASGSSGPATTLTWSRSGSRHSMESSPSSRAGAKVADVGCGHGASTDPDGSGLSRRPPSSARTITKGRSQRRGQGRRRRQSQIE